MRQAAEDDFFVIGGESKSGDEVKGAERSMQNRIRA
jgi:hypothetical protein